MKLKRLKVLLPVLTGMLLTNGPVSPISNNNYEMRNLNIHYNKKLNDINDLKNDECYVGSKSYNDIEYNVYRSDSFYGHFLFSINPIIEDDKFFYPFSFSRVKDTLFRGINYGDGKHIDETFIDRDKEIIFVNLDSVFVFDESKIISVKEKVSYDEDREISTRIFSYDLGNVCYPEQYGHNNIVSFGVRYRERVGNTIFWEKSDEDILEALKIELEQFFYSKNVCEYKKISKFKIVLKDVLPLLDTNYEISNFRNYNCFKDIEFYDYNNIEEILSNNGVSAAVPKISNVSDNPVIISEEYDLREFIYKCISDYYVVGSINNVIAFKNYNNSTFPKGILINFDVLGESFEDVSSKWLMIENVLFIEDFNFLYNNKKIINDENISVSYYSKLDIIRSILSPYEGYFDIFVDGNFYDFNSDELKYNTFNTLGYNSVSLVEFKPSISPKFIDDYNEMVKKVNFNSSFNFYFNFYDDIGPVISGDFKSFRTSDISNFKIDSYNFKANDEKDGDVSESIELIEEEGKYFIKAKDAAGNESKKEILLDIDPILYENINVINDEKIQVPENILLTKKRFEKILTKIHGVEPQDVDIIPYVNNCKTKGTYKVSYKINEETKEMDFEVVDSIKKNPEPGDVADQINEVKVSFIAKVKTFFNKLGNWFRGVFTKWKFDCFITNDQWDTRFN